MTRHLSLLIVLLLSFSVMAQESAETLNVGTLVTGTLDDGTPRIAYQLTASRGAIMRLRLLRVAGDLDPVLSIFDPSGALMLRRDDSQGTANVEVVVTFPNNGNYLLNVGRFGYELGMTEGRYELSIERIGISSEEGSSLQYGISITNTITNTQPRLFYTFQANEGDIVNISMIRSSGTLDPYIQLLDPNRYEIAANDDADGSTKNALIQNLLIERSGTYIIVASRYLEVAGDSAGSFVLRVDEARNSGLGNSQVAPASIIFNQTLVGALTPERYQQFYRFEGRRDQLVTITMQRTQFAGQLDAYLILRNAAAEILIEDDDGGNGSNARISDFRLPADGIYTIVATRFEGAEGETYGEYDLTLTDAGDAFGTVSESVPRLLYGTSVTDTISDDDPESLFAFYGIAGERVIIAMDTTSGNLDAVLELLDSQEVRMLRDDNSGFQDNARLDTVLTYSGVHYIRATRYEGTRVGSATAGTYRLSLTRINTGE